MTPTADVTSPSLLERARHNVPGAWDRLVERMAHLAAGIEKGERRRAQSRPEPGRPQRREALHRELDALRRVLEHLRQAPAAVQLGLLEQQLQHRLAGVAPGGEAFQLALAGRQTDRRCEDETGLDGAAAVHVSARRAAPRALRPLGGQRRH